MLLVLVYLNSVNNLLHKCTLHLTHRNSAVGIVVTFVTACLKIVYNLASFMSHLLAKFHVPSFGAE